MDDGLAEKLFSTKKVKYVNKIIEANLQDKVESLLEMLNVLLGESNRPIF